MSWFKRERKRTKASIAFIPDEDITTYELALCLRLFIAATDGTWSYAWELTPNEVRRHFKTIH